MYLLLLANFSSSLSCLVFYKLLVFGHRSLILNLKQVRCSHTWVLKAFRAKKHRNCAFSMRLENQKMVDKIPWDT